MSRDARLMNSATLAPPAVQAAPVPASRALVAAIGSAAAFSFDLYDLFLLLYLAPVLAPLFFPLRLPTLSLAAVYASFGVTLLMRPVGSAVFGSLADRHGRRWAMNRAVLGVGLVTGSLALLPTYARAGLIGPVLFLALRLVQGVFVGGVVASSHTIATESVAPRWRGFVSGAVGGGSGGVGTLLASTTLLVATGLFPGAAFAVWGWRFVFASGLVVALLSLFLFAWMEESPLWMDATERERPQAPLRTVLSGVYGRRFALNLLLVAGAATQYYLTGGFLPTFLPVVVRLPRPAVAEVLLAVAAAHILASLIVGPLSEVIGRRRTFLVVGLVDLAVLPLAYLTLAGAGPGVTARVVLLAAVLGFLGAAGHAAIMVFLNERYPTALRATGTSLNWNVGFAIGGITPTFVTLLSGSPHRIPAIVVGFLLASVVVYLAGALLVPETRGRFA